MTYDRSMLRTKAPKVHALVVPSGWTAAVEQVVTASLRGQTSAIGSDEALVDADGDLLVVTAPVAFAPGSVRALVRCASSPDRVVTRVMLPGGEPTDVVLWSAAWLRRHRVDLQRIGELGLDFDRGHLPHGDPQARAWVRADDVGITALTGARPSARGSVIAGLRLRSRHLVSSVRAMLGQARRARALARQRRQRFGT